jgi:hypothetical protein
MSYNARIMGILFASFVTTAPAQAAEMCRDRCAVRERWRWLGLKIHRTAQYSVDDVVGGTRESPNPIARPMTIGGECIRRCPIALGWIRRSGVVRSLWCALRRDTFPEAPGVANDTDAVRHER